MDLQAFSLLRSETEQLLGISLSEIHLNKLETFASELLQWNQKFNLTAITGPQQVRQKHFLDSISCMAVLPPQPGKVIDVGTGAGFPGVVLRVLDPSIQLTLADSVAKKTRFLSHIVQVLDLDGVEVLTARAEELGQDEVHRGTYDWAVARALAPMPTLLEYLLPLVRVGGHVLAQKGAEVGEEIESAVNALGLLGGEVEQVKALELPGGENHNLVVVNKIQDTPAKYPRRTGIPAKRPL